MPAVDWDHITPKVTEDVVSMLLNHIHPNRAQRINGEGGDDGRDVQIVLDDGLHAREIKSYKTTLKASQKTKIKNSLLTAAALNPVDWEVLLPHDFTPAELRWFDTLRPLVTFPIDWRGRTWLDTELAQRPFIQRYYLGDAYQEVRDLLELARQEEAGLARGALDALARIDRLATKLNEMDPYYVWEIASDGTTSRLTPRPRYRGAEIDYPLRATMRFAFPETPEAREIEEQLQRSYDFGTAVSVPEEYVVAIDFNALVLPDVPLTGRIEIGPADPDATETIILAVVDPHGTQLAELEFSGPSTAGLRGRLIDATDATGFVHLHFEADRQDRRMNLQLNVRIDGPYDARTLRSAIRFLAESAQPNTLEIKLLSGERLGSEPLTAEAPIASPGYARMLDDLTFVEWAARKSPKVGPVLSDEDLKQLAIGRLLVNGGFVTTTWESAEITVLADAPEEARVVYQGPEFRLARTEDGPFAVTIGGNEYPLGARRLIVMETAQLAPEHEDFRHNGVPAGSTVRVVPGSSNAVRLWILSADAPVPDLGLAEPVESEEQPES
ncbi:MAG: hypothetical protein ABI725_06185 [Chloroflexota bacterium]